MFHDIHFSNHKKDFFTFLRYHFTKIMTSDESNDENKTATEFQRCAMNSDIYR